jgi:hypothetical protein
MLKVFEESGCVMRDFRHRMVSFAGLSAAVLIQAILSGQDPADDPVEPKVSFYLDQADARPGETALLTFSVETTEPLMEISIAIDFDESKVRVLEVAPLQNFVDGAPDLEAPAGIASTTVSNVDTDAGNQSTEGWLSVMARVAPEDPGFPLNVDGRLPLLAIKFLVLPDAHEGFSAVKFESVGPLDTVSNVLRNQVILASRRDTKLPPTTTEGGGINIIGEVGFFMRGDASFDQERDISDPILSLYFLFVGGMLLPCMDSADSNDDGRLDVTDGVFTLQRLFQTGGDFPDPSEWGEDPTVDDLGCAASGG